MADNKTTIILEAKDAATATIGKVSTQMQTLGDVVGKFPGLASIGAGIAGAFAVGSIVEFTNRTIQSVDALNDLKDITGSSIENLSGLRGFAESTGHNFDVVSGSLTKLSKALHSTDEESKGAGKALAAIGLDINALGDMDPSLVMLEIAKALDKYEDSSSKAAVVTAIFGKEGAKLIPYLKDLAEQGSLVAEVTTEQAEAADKYNKSLAGVQHNLKIAAQSMIAEMLPAITRLSEEFKLGLKYSNGFFDALMKYGLTNPFKSNADKLKGLEAEIGPLEDKVSIGRGTKKDQERLDSLRQQISYYRDLEKLNNKTSQASDDKPRIKYTGDNPKSDKAGKDKKAELSDELKSQLEKEQALIKEQIKARELVEDYKRLNEQTVQRIERQSQLATMNERSRTIAEALYRVEDDYSKIRERIIRDIEDQTEQSKALAEVDAMVVEQKKRVAEATAKSYDQMRTFEFGATRAFQRYVDEAGNAAASAERVFTNAFQGMEDALVSFVQTGKLDFNSLANSIIADLIRMQVRAAMSKATAGIAGFLGFGSSAGGVDTSFTSGLGGAATMNTGGFDWTFSKDGNAFASNGLQFFAKGGAFTNGIYSSPTLFKFANGSRFGVMGEAGPEAVMPLKRDSSGRLGVIAGGGGQPVVNINVVNESGQQLTATGSAMRNESGGFDLQMMVTQAVTSDLSRNGPIAKGILGMTGARRAV